MAGCPLPATKHSACTTHTWSPSSDDLIPINIPNLGGKTAAQRGLPGLEYGSTQPPGHALSPRQPGREVAGPWTGGAAVEEDTGRLRAGAVPWAGGSRGVCEHSQPGSGVRGGCYQSRGGATPHAATRSMTSDLLVSPTSIAHKCPWPATARCAHPPRVFVFKEDFFARNTPLQVGCRS